MRSVAKSPYPTEFTRALGRVVLAGTNLEAETVLVYRSMFGSSKRHEPDGFTPAMVRLRKSLRKEMQGPALWEVLAYLRQSQHLWNRRSRVVHALWSARPDSSGRFLARRIRDPTEPFLMSIADLDRLANDITEHRRGFNKIMILIPAELHNKGSGAQTRPMINEELRSLWDETPEAQGDS